MSIENSSFPWHRKQRKENQKSRAMTNNYVKATMYKTTIRINIATRTESEA